MSESKHTPGPLAIRLTGTCSAAWAEIGQVVDGEFYDIARTNCTHTERRTKRGKPIAGIVGTIETHPRRFELTHEGEEMLANAKLWAAAPRLLTELQGALQALESAGFTQLAGTARAAIAAAIGDQP